MPVRLSARRRRRSGAPIHDLAAAMVAALLAAALAGGGGGAARAQSAFDALTQDLDLGAPGAETDAAAGGAAADPFDALPVPVLGDPLAGGAAPDCAQILAEERAKLGCPPAPTTAAPTTAAAAADPGPDAVDAPPGPDPTAGLFDGIGGPFDTPEERDLAPKPEAPQADAPQADAPSRRDDPFASLAGGPSASDPAAAPREPVVEAGATGGLADDIDGLVLDFDLDLGVPDEDTGDAPVAPPSIDKTRAQFATGPRPMKRADAPELDRRVLTLPGAELSPAPGAAGAELPAFTVFYVYEEAEGPGGPWLRVGRSAAGRLEGWVAAERTEDWKTMLVMEYAEKGGRGQVLFFRRQDDLEGLVQDRFVSQEAAAAYERIEAGAHSGDIFVAIEPAIDVDPDQTYLMPVLDHAETVFDNLEEVKLLQVAGLNLDAAAPVQETVEGMGAGGIPARHGAMADFSFGIVFAIDTTSSMGPFIDYTRAVVHAVVKAFRQAGLEDRVSLGLVGYRDNLGPNPAIEYVTRTYQYLDPAADPDTVLRNFELMAPTTASTQGFDEDAFAGLDAALNGMDWTPFDLRMVVLITDAGARRGNDPMAAIPDYDVINVLDTAGRLNVAVSAIHLQTPQARRAGNVPSAEEIYRQIAASGDATTSKYFGVDTENPNAFAAQIKSFAQSLVAAVGTAARGKRVVRQETVETLGDALVNEVFRAQLEYLGAEEGQAPPRFYRAWAADKDLLNPDARALEVKVFLTRQQLSGLVEGSEIILEAYEAQETGGRDFFELMRTFSAQNAVEGAGSRPIAEAGQLFPAFLETLPYRSDFLALDAARWSAGGPSYQRELTDVLRSKLGAYRDIAESQVGWIDLGAGQRSEDVFPVSLSLLP